MFFSETWFPNESQIYMDNYQGFYCNMLNLKAYMKNQSRGRVCIYGRDYMDITDITDITEQIWCRVIIGVETI